jgi:hypothetical protein
VAGLGPVRARPSECVTVPHERPKNGSAPTPTCIEVDSRASDGIRTRTNQLLRPGLCRLSYRRNVDDETP